MKAGTFAYEVDPLLTDLYQLTMAYGYWKNQTHEKYAVFDLFFRKCPFGGEFAVFAGLGQVLTFLERFRFQEHHVRYLKSLPDFQSKEPEFFEWLLTLDASEIRVMSQAEGALVFPKVPMLRVEGPLAVVQLLETTFLTLVNYPSLVATNAARYRLAAGWDKALLEFGLRRAQGPNGGLSASLYSYIGGFDSTSNVKAGELFGIPVAGTHAHAYVESFLGLHELKMSNLSDKSGQLRDFLSAVTRYREKLGYSQTSEGELAAFVAYALAFPDRFTALVDTYNTLESGIPNFLCVASALFEWGYQPRGVRLDSGDLAFLSIKAKELFQRASQLTGFDFSLCRVTASNDINEKILYALKTQNHEIDNFGIGTNLVTCEAQPAFGGVFKLVEIGGEARVKLSENIAKITIPGKKKAWRLFGKDGIAVVDLMTGEGEPRPTENKPILCRHPFDSTKRVNVVPTKVVELLHGSWNGTRSLEPESPEVVRERCIDQLKTQMRHDHLRYDHPAEYKVSVSEKLFETMHRLIERETIVKTLT